MRTTLAQARASQIPKILGVCSTDSRVVTYINEATQRLMTRGKWVGTVQKYAVCVSGGCITWPRQIATIESVAVCDTPIKIRNEWHEFLENGVGLRDADDGGLTLYDRGTACSFDDMSGTTKKIKVYADVPEDSSARILLQGLDENGNWIRTQDAGSWVDGEYVSINASTPQLSTKFFSSLTSVQKPVTNGTVRIYQYDTVATTQTPMGYYEPDETIPWYRRSLITDLVNQGACDGASTSCATKAVTVMAKMAFIPVVNDTDYLLIGNIPALKDMIQSIRKYENNLFEEAQAWESKAIMELDKELSSYLGDGPTISIKTEHRSIYGGAVDNVI